MIHFTLTNISAVGHFTKMPGETIIKTSKHFNQKHDILYKTIDDINSEVSTSQASDIATLSILVLKQ